MDEATQAQIAHVLFKMIEDGHPLTETQERELRDWLSIRRQVELRSKQRISELEARLAEAAHAYDVCFKRRVELEAAILPFAEFALDNVDADRTVWSTTTHKEPISTWFGPSEFLALAKLKA